MLQFKSGRILPHLAFLFVVAANITIGSASENTPNAGVSGGILADQLLPLLENHRGDVAVCVRHLETGEQFEWRADEPQPTASLIKLPIMITAYRMVDDGRLNLNTMVTLTDEDKVPGSGILTDHFSAGTSLSLRDAVRLMIRYSDNTATNLVIDKMGLPATSEMMNSLGFKHTRLHSKVYRGSSSIDPERSRLYGLGSTSAREMVELLSQLHKRSIVTQQSGDAIVEHLMTCEDGEKLGADLPDGVRFAHKTGSVNASRTDAGILFGPGGPVAICVLTTNNADKSWKEGNEAHRLCAKIGRLVCDHFYPKSTRGAMTADASLQNGSNGELVEMLQRTLNARMSPSPQLSVDGDFGPATEKAVREFQEARSLDVTGVVQSDFWKALGPLLPPEEIPAPEIVNSEVLPLQSMEDLNAAPAVTCRAWTIMDLQSGETLWSQSADQHLDMASTTKIMTAWLIVKFASSQPEILDEVLIFSDRADKTPGSTSALKAGEKITVREALYGLMLPSGNDMSIALAEHFGSRLAPESADSLENEEQVSDPVRNFVMAMNNEASRLQMTETHFMNPHGLTSKDHYSTASDLALLSYTALQDPLFRHYVTTRRHGTAVEGASGYVRNVLWENTNQLLQIQGYGGVKTGTTEKAGACLVSTSKRGGKELLMVVLGSAASASRYADSRNLYRWAWQQLNVE
ncbi:MAG: serine hydrolase [Planctomycetaceae bacterium]|nr:serine hydrolase [Planctomycetaceae bacterium]